MGLTDLFKVFSAARQHLANQRRADQALLARRQELNDQKAKILKQIAAIQAKVKAGTLTGAALDRPMSELSYIQQQLKESQRAEGRLLDSCSSRELHDRARLGKAYKRECSEQRVVLKDRIEELTRKKSHLESEESGERRYMADRGLMRDTPRLSRTLAAIDEVDQLLDEAHKKLTAVDETQRNGDRELAAIYSEMRSS